MLKKYLWIAIIYLTTIQISNAQQSPWPIISSQTKPWTRLWWMGSAVDSSNLSICLRAYAKAGLGGVEITPIYGVKGYESRYLNYLSPEWNKALNTSILLAKQNEMGVDLNLGTGWPFGGPQISQDLASSRFFIQKYQIQAGQSRQITIELEQPQQHKKGAYLQVLTAYADTGETLILTDFVQKDGTLAWSPEKGTWTLYALFMGKTGQKVKRAAPGGEGWVMDHFSEKAFQQYIKRFDDSWKKVPEVRSFFNDSYEVYEANFTPDFLQKFQHLNGYDLRFYLQELASNELSEKVSRVKSDFKATLDYQLTQGFMKPWTDWAHAKGKKVRNQAHGSPANILDLYAQADIPECETFGSTYFPIKGLRRDTADIRKVHPEPLMMRFAPSAGHVMGKKLISAEAFTWLTEHFRTSLSQCKPEIEQLFLAGVNHVFFHGTTYSPAEANWPGWMFYAGVNFSPNNTFWPHLSGLNSYITRCQSILQMGKPANDVLIYSPIQDIWHQTGDVLQQIRVHEVDTWLYPTPFYQIAKRLKTKGYSFDFISDKQILQTKVENGLVKTATDASAYKVIIVPKTKYMPLETLEALQKLATAGAKIIFESLPADVNGLNQLEERRAVLKKINQGISSWAQISNLDSMEELLAKDAVVTEELVATGLQYIKRKAEEGTYYFLVNHTEKNIDTVVKINEVGKSVLLLDALTGKYGDVPFQKNIKGVNIRIQLKSGESVFVLVQNKLSDSAKKWKYEEERKATDLSTKQWSLAFQTGGPILPQNRTLRNLDFWTNTTDTTAQFFSGTALYSTQFEWKKSTSRYILDLGQVAESAKVFVNKQEVGILWSVPFQIDISKYLKNGTNVIEIEVANLMANRIRYMDQHQISWRNYHEINFVNAHYKPFDASNWKVMDAGLKGPVRIIETR
ncbi:glycosyl hydrolase [Cellulophaga sp. BC115SP]|uniref:glycosyl hydrolase n=1 Tax=Cellulophaga sp. BC115SP TaxID=2683263 RepID=UPI001411BC04|nr:glycosyl hydrolase [Cellulophaga sp. BC115SP]NBB29689.1 glycoside hydrolase [Cellulophaga sp. BC115SP]